MFRIAVAVCVLVGTPLLAAIILPSSPLHRRVSMGIGNVRQDLAWYRDLLECEAERVASKRREMQRLVSPAGAEERLIALQEAISEAVKTEDRSAMLVARVTGFELVKVNF